jgi:polyhydroxyalkanoate synthesis regulator phasin
MKHLEDDDLILYLYGEAEDPEAMRRQMEDSEELRARCETLRRVLAAVDDDALPVPERGEGYGAEVWARIEPKLHRGRLIPFPARVSHPAIGWAAAALILLAVGFGLGRLSRPAALPQEARDRILIATVANHLDRSERLLAEVSNSGTADLSAERAWARDLLNANRLYRQSAQQAGRQRLAGVLDELEPFLLDHAHAPDEPSAEQIEELRERIAAQSLLFKVRVASNRLESQKQTL